MTNISVGLGSVYAAIAISLFAFFYSFPNVDAEFIPIYIGFEVAILIGLSILQFLIMSKDHQHEIELEKLRQKK